MARLSVYIPDELFEQAKSLGESENTSALVQRGLQRLIDDQKATPPYARRPEGSFRAILDLRERLLAEARADYELGYSVALKAASGMPLHALNRLVEQNLDLEKWLKPFKAAALDELIEKSGPPITDTEDMKKTLLKTNTGPPLSADAFTDSEWWWVWKTAEALGELATAMDFDEFTFTPTQARQRGFSDALFHLWSAIESGEEVLAIEEAPSAAQEGVSDVKGSP